MDHLLESYPKSTIDSDTLSNIRIHLVLILGLCGILTPCHLHVIVK
jgi:hypothetical protein